MCGEFSVFPLFPGEAHASRPWSGESLGFPR
ncbi:hypothetical protein T4A_8089 [Trichinella pseudospiralis]|uniref:Uncharacterized protein n=1 Tax=Trichinella pseudospiralis TaxID=6337 RepID=A0A0V1C3B7_TRIPS|nr:hypothetical protein T4A_8089 [Trichinella pseudospiralis]KRY61976.1 hypothetical protein T4D_13246 [Trichinella pseudospiralis]